MPGIKTKMATRKKKKKKEENDDESKNTSREEKNSFGKLYLVCIMYDVKNDQTIGV